MDRAHTIVSFGGLDYQLVPQNYNPAISWAVGQSAKSFRRSKGFAPFCRHFPIGITVGLGLAGGDQGYRARWFRVSLGLDRFRGRSRLKVGLLLVASCVYLDHAPCLGCLQTNSPVPLGAAFRAHCMLRQLRSSRSCGWWTPSATTKWKPNWQNQHCHKHPSKSQ